MRGGIRSDRPRANFPAQSFRGKHTKQLPANLHNKRKIIETFIEICKKTKAGKMENTRDFSNTKHSVKNKKDGKF